MNELWWVSYGVLWVLVLTLVALLLLLYRQLGEMYLGTPEGRSREGIQVGKQAPAFTLLDQDGKQVTVPSAMPSLLVFGLPTCGPCRDLMPDLAAFSRQYRRHIDVFFIAGEDIEQNLRFAREYTAPFPVLTQPGLGIMDSYRVRRSPFAFYVDADGDLRTKGVVNGFVDLERLIGPRHTYASSSDVAARSASPMKGL